MVSEVGTPDTWIGCIRLCVSLYHLLNSFTGTPCLTQWRGCKVDPHFGINARTCSLATKGTQEPAFLKVFATEPKVTVRKARESNIIKCKLSF